MKQDIEIINKLGLHARASSLFVQVASRFKSQVQVSFHGQTVNGKSILGLMMLEAIKGSIITLEVVGPDEKEAMSALLQLINHYFLEGE
jgi:phosphocarrier protein HPr